MRIQSRWATLIATAILTSPLPAFSGERVHVSLGNGKGGVTATKVTSNIGLDPKPPADNPFLLSKIVLADFNRDGKDDLYYIECCNTFVIVQLGAFGVLVSNGDGTFT